jgi:hypothetical protein
LYNAPKFVLLFAIPDTFTQVRVLLDLVASMMMNAYVLRVSKLELPKSYTSFQFLEALLEQLSPAVHVETPEIPEHPAGKDEHGKIRKVEKPFWNSDVGAAWRLDGKDHYCEDANNQYPRVSNKRNAEGNLIRHELRRKCRWCNKKTVYFCEKCAAPLCVGVCFKSFHTCRTINS